MIKYMVFVKELLFCTNVSSQIWEEGRSGGSKLRFYGGILSLLHVQLFHSSVHKFYQLSSKSPALHKAGALQMKEDFWSISFHFLIGKAPVLCDYC